MAAILDLYARFVADRAVRAVNDRHLTMKARGRALKRRCPAAGLIHPPDQGCTYASEDYQRMLDADAITCSMSRRGNCYDNAVMEAFFSSLKSEVADRCESCGVAKMELFDCRGAAAGCCAVFGLRVLVCAARKYLCRSTHLVQVEPVSALLKAH